VRKSILKIFCVILLAAWFMLSTIAFAANADTDIVKYEIPELSVTFDVPSDIKVIPQGIRQSDPIFSNKAFDYIQVMTKFRDHGDYYYGKSLTQNYEFEVKVLEDQNKINNFTKLSEKKQFDAMKTISQQPDIIEYSIYKNEAAAFIEISRSTNDTDGRFFSKEYYTVFEGFDITVKLTSQNDSLTNQEKELIKNIADSISFPQEKVVDLSKLLTRSVVVPFTFLIAMFVCLVIAKIRSIKQEEYREQRKQKRMEERRQRDEKEKKEADAKGFEAFESNDFDPQMNNTENNKLSADHDTGFPEIDLESAIANFDSNK